MSSGLKLAGHLYRPPNAPTSQKTPAIAMCGPISAVKEQVTPHYAQKLAEAGYTVLTFDSRNFGESGGEPRQHYDPNEVILDYHHAVSYLLTRGDVDAENVAAVGVCMGGGYTVSLAVMDKRLKAAVSVAGGYNIGGTFQQQQGVKPFAQFYRMINDTVQEGYATGEPQYVPTIAKGLG